MDIVKLPQLLVLGPPSVFNVYEREFSTKFHILKPYESPLPTEIYMQTHGQPVRAILCSGKSQVTAQLLRLLPSLQLVMAPGTGVNHIDLPECRRLGISVTNTGDVFSQDTADYAVGLLIDVLRKISAGDRHVRRGAWPVHGDYSIGVKLGGKQVGIVGLGNIGSKVARRLEAFGCIISYNSRTKKSSVPYSFYPNVCELALNSNILFICCSLTEQTRHLINKDVMTALGKDGIIVNVGRGPIIDESELVKFLVEGEIAGAGLDVFENEPTVPKELFGLDNVVITPHRAAFTQQAFFEAFNVLVANLEAFFSNKPLITPV
ncbi:glyoxylate/hydroxypyruvate reductase HPR3-like isoform X2 [Olea europaea var. sylvestris]|uniref:glyoxylate/hydroxypyruvate reductase HPR3-like isoform X2 n=1 Tax=Olea europaea var. sylvestris TaxID=158386 RepID=UPI000C1D1A6B|nr:glyoxylate/hydroxypyruvate reductase HPR3-like isoform X2 [Olea europaea var. sylvestris]